MSNIIPAANPLIGQDERAAVERVLASGMLAQGPEVAAFEREFSQQLVNGVSCHAVSSGTSGLHIGLMACGVKAGDEVIVPSFTFAATANAVKLVGAEPVFVDIDPETYCIDPRAAEAAITSRTAGIMPVHLYGHPADMAALSKIASKHGVRIFEDAAQAHGAKWQGKPVGSFGDFAMFSLYPTKNMTSGEGGMISFLEDETGRQIRLLRNQGMEERYRNEVIGFNMRMTDLHAAIGRVQLTKLKDWTSKRQDNARFFDDNLIGVKAPRVRLEAEHVYHQYTIRVEDDRDGFAKALAAEYGVQTGVYYPTPVHELPSFGLKLDLPETALASKTVLSLPVYPTLSDNERERVVQAVNAIAKAGA